MVEGAPYKGEGRSKKGSKWDGVNNVPNPTFRADNHGTRYPRSVQYFKTAESEKAGALHPTQKPVALYKWLLHNYAKQGDKILDTHLGSGSIAIACHQMGFDLTGSELDKDYFDAMQKRIKYETAQKDMFG